MEPPADEPVFVTGVLYDRFRRGDRASTGPGFEVLRVHFESEERPVGAELAWDENERFVFPLFLPAGGPFRDVVIILNGLNDSSYRKFFPWGASLAHAGVPAMIFPSAFLLNRRPREWISPSATERAWQSRLRVAPDSASPINAVLSARVAEYPRTLLLDALRTAEDLRQLLLALEDGQLRGDTAGVLQRLRGARSHILGYSLGGYLALALRLHDRVFEAAKVIALCAGAGTQVGLSPVSPFILDRAATELLLREVSSLAQAAPEYGPLAATLVELFTCASEATREQLRDLGSELFVIGGRDDRIVPAQSILANLGRLDAVLPLGIHEYPFNLATYEGAGVAREVARSHRVAPDFQDTFREFMRLVRQVLPSHSAQE